MNKKEVIYDNTVVVISNYATDVLPNTLTQMGEQGYKLVNAILAKNKYNVDVMYCFFTKECYN